VPEVIGVYGRYKGAFASPHPRIPRRRHATILLLQQLDAAVGISQSSNDRCCSIGRTIVNDYYFDIPMRLGEHGRQGTLDEWFRIVGRDDNRHERVGRVL